MVTDSWKDLIGREFGTVYVDPPWPNMQLRPGKRAVPRYDTMPLDQIQALPIPSLVADNAILWLWYTFAYRDAATQLMRHWGFQVRCEIVWDKSWIGGGEWVRWRHEYLLVGKRGRPQ